ncbi:uncharacterized protein A1O9_11654 [Exophiala aquamarina CBS 119918]|uniref:Uncharacterized protein n=1 Tax=Exophiala aquamarina CBS 119918 TaxID=1182545 RepID=A0A072NZF8_9EURO|nr:uncharacterized protein A1O9_11654 [Exophiala aquamarina CBS 119918]KEF52413.1 hypothetical protein A1O9_11654 [Exophiala aquamarina CBS 119918]
MSAYVRGGPSAINAPTRPRGAPSGPARDFSSPPIRGRGSLSYRGSAPYGPRGGGYARGDYSGTRGDYGGGRGDYGGGRGDLGGGPRGDLSGGNYRGATSERASSGGVGAGQNDTSFPFRGNSSSSTTYPRTQRFNSVQQHLATTEKIIPGGKLLPSGLPPDQDKRIKILEAEAERMRKEILEKQRIKREVMNEWETRERESDRERLRSELADAHLQQLVESDDGIGRAAF